MNLNGGFSPEKHPHLYTASLRRVTAAVNLPIGMVESFLGLSSRKAVGGTSLAQSSRKLQFTETELELSHDSVFWLLAEGR